MCHIYNSYRFETTLHSTFHNSEQTDNTEVGKSDRCYSCTIKIFISIYNYKSASYFFIKFCTPISISVDIISKKVIWYFCCNFMKQKCMLRFHIKLFTMKFYTLVTRFDS